MGYHDKDALLYRLSEGLKDTGKSVVFVLGAPAAATFGDLQGVANVAEVVQLIRSRFASKGRQLETLDARLLSSENPYQTAFDFLTGREGQNAANAIVKQAVAQALKNPPQNGWTNEICNLGNDELNTLNRPGIAGGHLV